VDGKLVELPSTTEDSSNASQVQKKNRAFIVIC
jgi:hypothetical protein